MASRFYRFTMKRTVRCVAVGLMLLGWSIVIMAANTAPLDETNDHIKFVATVFGGALAFMAMLGGVSRWVAVPAARQILAEHIKNGPESHKDLVSRQEWDQKHSEVLDRLAELSADVRALPTRVLLQLEQKGGR